MERDMDGMNSFEDFSFGHSPTQVSRAPMPAPRKPDRLDEMVGRSAALAAVYGKLEAVARTDCAVLILGETGTGKEVLARAVHARSPRAERRFVKLNCAAVPGGLLESELFGHERGAFTGAVSRRTGRFELADRGTIFLDEVGELDLDLQPKLLRVLQEREFERLGGTQTLHTNCRLIAATNCDLRAMVAERSFREDLYYRLNVFPISLPPLRERRGDIPLLVAHFVREISSRLGRRAPNVPSAVMAQLERHHWPGNIRELENVVERALILSRGESLVLPDWDEVVPVRSSQVEPNDQALDSVTRAHILSVLESTNWVVAGPRGAAARLGLKRSTLNFRMRKLGIVRAAR